MECGEMPVSLPSITKLNEELQNQLRSHIKDYVSTVLNDISDTFRIPRNTLFSSYLTDDLLDRYCGDVPKKCRKDLNSEERCWAKIGTNARCSRKHQKDVLFCGSHINMDSEIYIENSENPEPAIAKKKVVCTRREIPLP